MRLIILPFLKPGTGSYTQPVHGNRLSEWILRISFCPVHQCPDMLSSKHPLSFPLTLAYHLFGKCNLSIGVENMLCRCSVFVLVCVSAIALWQCFLEMCLNKTDHNKPIFLFILWFIHSLICLFIHSLLKLYISFTSKEEPLN